MPKRSIKENKNTYMRSREAARLTRDAASELLGFISADRIYRIENGALPDPEEVLQMAESYQDMSLCNYYCANECRIRVCSGGSNQGPVTDNGRNAGDNESFEQRQG